MLGLPGSPVQEMCTTKLLAIKYIIQHYIVQHYDPTVNWPFSTPHGIPKDVLGAL